MAGKSALSFCPEHFSFGSLHCSSSPNTYMNISLGKNEGRGSAFLWQHAHSLLQRGCGNPCVKAERLKLTQK